MGAYLTPHLWEREVKSRVVEGGAEAALAQPQTENKYKRKKDPIFSAIWVQIGSHPYLSSDRLFQRTHDVSTTELNRKLRSENGQNLFTRG